MRQTNLLARANVALILLVARMLTRVILIRVVRLVRREWTRAEPPHNEAPQEIRSFLPLALPNPQ